MKKITSTIKKLIKIDKLLDKQTPLFLLLVLVLVLRIPNIFEPYWYGDEGIYLTIGQSLNRGAKLYTEIIDHKTPIIYFLARVHTQLNFRLLNIAWMLVTTSVFFYFSKKLLDSVKLSTLAGLIFVLLTTLPWLEGNIPNGELFVLGFVLTGFLILTKSQYFIHFLQKKPVEKTHQLSLFFCGFFIGLGILTKVPAILDLGTIFSIAYFSWVNLFSVKKISKSLEYLIKLSYDVLHIFLGAALPIVISIIYFISVDSGKDYLDFGLLYNFRYAGSWGLPFDNQFLIQSFTLPGKLVYFLILVILLTLFRKHIKPVMQFILLWFFADLFAALLSNRPYPHYFIQIIPPFSLLIALTLQYIKQLTKKIIPISLSILVISLFITVMMLLEFKPYRSLPYYTNWFRLVTGKISKDEYNQSFDNLMKDNYEAAPIIKSAGSSDLFIWGTNPMLYALSQTQPTGRFTVSFHIKDFDAYGETARDFVLKSPTFIVVMKNEKDSFPELNNFLIYNYVQDDNQFDNFVLWKKMNANYY